jgi:hypothetical protein
MSHDNAVADDASSQTVEEIMQKLGCSEIEANEILAHERGVMDDEEIEVDGEDDPAVE